MMSGRHSIGSEPEEKNASTDDTASEADAKGSSRFAPTDEDKTIVRRTVENMVDANQKNIRAAKLVGGLVDHDQRGTIAYAVAKQVESKHRRIDGTTMLKEVIEFSQCKDVESIKLAYRALDKYGDGYIDVASMVAVAQESGIQISEDDVACLEKLGGLTKEDMIKLLMEEEESG